MQSFYRTHKHLIEHLQAPVRRPLMEQINWGDRLIGIKGARGVGKTTFLLQYAKEHFAPNDKTCLYVNVNNFYVQNEGIARFAHEFYTAGGRTLLIDQVFKQPEWPHQLRRCYDQNPGLHIVFTGSPVMRLGDEQPELSGLVKSYNLRGFSFREYLNLRAHTQLPSVSLDDILQQHTQIAQEITNTTDPHKYLPDYLHHGYYPFFLESQNFAENLLKTMNMMMEVDILLIKQIEIKYLPKIKQLFYLLTRTPNNAPNISELAATLGISRATVTHYIKCLAEARLVNMIYHKGEQYPKKPARVLLHNPNLLYSCYPEFFDEQDVQEAFLCNALWRDHLVNKHTGKGAFLVDETHEVRLAQYASTGRSRAKGYFAVSHMQRGEGNQIPLWLFGFLA